MENRIKLITVLRMWKTNPLRKAKLSYIGRHAERTESRIVYHGRPISRCLTEEDIEGTYQYWSREKRKTSDVAGS
jgi:hypothetical protein